ncbi:MAG: hypothetical protein VYB20_04660 [Pseudomonadota bacterium]|jgi:hypothetical protein|uniref:Uncharacterized protein n=1 Tax=Vreelandella aquamarina TaxID=77097 RepID=A0A0D7UY74_9GAMM|nr:MULTISPECIES: hypothetical protein [Halomonas]KTG25734.1 hypothetical protein AUR68_20265 [Idiomarina sp. H105]MEC7295555.1 hypothetical protein [Pseudomonadota bacterium]OAE95568.1 hypothetical protein AWR38_20295 [Idiomarina sp. WRN-38]KJD19565.1 hypothetical protein VE30_07240 [Halomonas meridiana]MAD21267.1 hypothetical protein [Halomonas sp.]|tara:strand:- start:156 stop:371 length:216 start_codon:yes stop_codon:yes gene_type:complete
MRFKIPTPLSVTGISTLSALTFSTLLLSTTVYGYTPSGKDITYGLNGESFEGYLVSAGEDAKGSVLIVPQR